MLARRSTALEVVEDIQMFAGREQFEEDVMLRADTHEFTELVHLIEHVDIVASRCTLRLLDQASQHRDDGGLTCTIVAQKSEDLTVIHLDVDTPHSSEAASKGLLQVLYAEVVPSGFEALANDRGRLIVLSGHLILFEVVVFFRVHHTNSLSLLDLTTTAVSTAA